MVGRRYDTGRCVEVSVENGIIAEISEIPDRAGLPWISAGWIDLQVQGFGGYDLNGETTTADAVDGVTRGMLAHGVTRYLPTIVTGSRTRIR